MRSPTNGEGARNTQKQRDADESSKTLQQLIPLRGRNFAFQYNLNGLIETRIEDNLKALIIQRLATSIKRELLGEICYVEHLNRSLRIKCK
eukprot:scaffold2462_cov127-Cylindrotheca_fusiformis.AAC.7